MRLCVDRAFVLFVFHVVWKMDWMRLLSISHIASYHVASNSGVCKCKATANFTTNFRTCSCTICVCACVCAWCAHAQHACVRSCCVCACVCVCMGVVCVLAFEGKRKRGTMYFSWDAILNADEIISNPVHLILCCNHLFILHQSFFFWLVVVIV